MKQFLTVVTILIALASASYGAGHRAMVRASGIRPLQVGTHEGVGMSSRSFEAARNNACYWGQRVPLSVQYSKRGGLYYAVVRYR